jgi:carboxyl-terminal processing protease
VNYNGIVSLIILLALATLLIGCKSISLTEDSKLASTLESSTKNLPSENKEPLKQIESAISHSVENPFDTSFYRTSTARIASIIKRAHFVNINYDDDYSERVFNQLIKAIDPSNLYLSVEDIRSLAPKKHSFDDILATRELPGAYEFIESLLALRDLRLSAAIALANEAIPERLEKPRFFRSTLSNRLQLNSELNRYWAEKVKIDVHNLLLLGIKKDNVNNQLQSRYLNTRDKFRLLDVSQKYTLLMSAYAKSVDSHTQFLPTIPTNSPIELFPTQPDSTLQQGIGLILKSSSNESVIQSIYPGSPADIADLKVNDSLAAIIEENGNFIDLLEMDSTESTQLLSGKIGTIISLKIIRQTLNGSRILDIDLVRNSFSKNDFGVAGIIEISNESGSKIGVIKINSFYHEVSADVKQEVIKLQEKQIDGLLIDLRNNGGGSLIESIKVAGLFIEKGPVSQVRDGGNRIKLLNIEDQSVYYHGPLTLLVNAESAGASEILTAAIKDYGRGIVIGDRTYGYGSVQQHRPLGRIYDLYEESFGSVQFTIAKFYRINGESTQRKGVTPDIEIHDNLGLVAREETNDYALPWDSISTAIYTQLSYASEVKMAVKTIQEKNLVMQNKAQFDPATLLKQAIIITDRYSQALNVSQ